MLGANVPEANAAPAEIRGLDKLPFEKHAALSFLGSISLPTSAGSLSDREWLGEGKIETGASCSSDTVRSRSKIVFADGTDTTSGVSSIRRNKTAVGQGLDGKPFALTADMGNGALYDGGFNAQTSTPPGAIITAQEFWFVITCDTRASVTGSSPLESPYFAIKLISDGANWKVAQDNVPVEDQATTTTLSATSSRADGRVDFAASVVAAGGTVDGGTVDFIDADAGVSPDRVLATGTVVSGKAAAISKDPISAVDGKGVNVKAVYTPAAGFIASESAAQLVYGVRPPDVGTVGGDVTVEVPVRDTPSPTGAVQFTAAAEASLGKATFTAAGLTASGSINGATVTDTRKDKSAAWVVSGTATSFSTQAAPIANKLSEIPAAALTWSPKEKAGTTLPSGAVKGSAGAKLDGNPSLVSWTSVGSGQGDLVSQVGADLNLDAKGDFVPGSYSAKLTLTLI